MKNKTLLLLSAMLITIGVIAAPIDKFDTITTNNPTKAKVDFLKGAKFITTDSIIVPVGTTGQRDASPTDGMFRLNTTAGKPEMYVSSAWVPLGNGDSSLWVTATPYIIGNIVIQSNKFYRCLIAHTSGTFATDLGSGDWVEISGQGDLTGDITSSGLVTTIGAGKVVNSMVNASAAIAYSKLNLTTSILNADINGSAAIAYSKLALSNSIVNADISSGAAIVYGKLDLTASILNTDIGSGAAIAYSKFASLSTGQVVCGNGGTASACTLSGGASVGNTGVVTLGNTAVTGQLITGFSSGSGTVAATDTILQSINKLDGNIALKAPLASPTFTGHITTEGVTATGATGTGKFVFDTAPTIASAVLTGPALGTPVSGVATNLTGTAASLTAGTATNIAGGLGGSIPYQTAVNTTALLANGTSGQYLKSNGTTLAPSWVTPSALSSVAPTFTDLTTQGATTGWLFTISSGNATVGATYTDSVNGAVYTVLGTISGQTKVFTSQVTTPGTSGTLTKGSGTGDTTLTYSSRNALATYTAPVGPAPLYLEIEFIGGGGGGSGQGVTAGAGSNGVAGGITAFGTGYANGGGAGLAGGAAASSGGTSFLGTSIIGSAIKGGSGAGFQQIGTITNYINGGAGCTSPLGGAGASSSAGYAGTAAIANTGSGGAGGGGASASNSFPGTGGACGGYVTGMITTMELSFPYAIGTGGGGGAGNAGAAYNGTDGGSGRIRIKEMYQ